MTVNVLLSEVPQIHPPDVFSLADHLPDVDLFSSADEETIIYCENFPDEDADEIHVDEDVECDEKEKDCSNNVAAEVGTTELDVAMEVDVETSQEAILKCN